MSNSIISIEKVSKRYIIAHRRQRGDDGLRHVLDRALRPRHWLRAVRERRSATREEFWALRDVTLEIKQGEVIGFIGRNGAGKSTLLKILSRITEPTEGRVRLRGRTASLLEVGTGFHPELTGRENISLNGAILGMSSTEIRRKFDEIVAFAEVEQFLDTPVKRYSSGMYVRLAFAVAAHLEPEILLVDEVLAVGDATFQKKCLDKMDHVGHTGRTVLFVSHNMQAVTRLCQRCVLLDEGRVRLDGPSQPRGERVSQLRRRHDGCARVARPVQGTRRQRRSPLRSAGAIRARRADRCRRHPAPGRHRAGIRGAAARLCVSSPFRSSQRRWRAAICRAGCRPDVEAAPAAGGPLQKHGVDSGQSSGRRGDVGRDDADDAGARSGSRTACAMRCYFASSTRSQRRTRPVATIRGPFRESCGHS